ncbi:hypothetical protein ACH3XW_46720 [Acanthocheilonema viteae]
MLAGEKEKIWRLHHTKTLLSSLHYSRCLISQRIGKSFKNGSYNCDICKEQERRGWSRVAACNDASNMESSMCGRSCLND